MSEVPLYGGRRKGARLISEAPLYRGTSLISEEEAPWGYTVDIYLGPYGGPRGGGMLSYERGTLPQPGGSV